MAQPKGTLKIVFSIAGAGVLICAAYFIYQAMHQAIEEARRPRIWFDALVKDIGKVDEGVEINLNFKVGNKGGKPLEITDIKSSCGCTFPVWKQRRLMPGETVDLPVMIDTAMKQDKVEKTMDVFSNDPQSRFTTLSIKLEINDPHKGMAMDMGGKGKPKIFASEKCTSCHVDQGVGQYGKDLFEADCAMCHRPGVHDKPSVGPVLESLDYSNAAFRKTIKNVICYGSKTHRSMPAFLGDADGPLSMEQIDSIVDYLRTCKGVPKPAAATGAESSHGASTESSRGAGTEASH